LRRASADHSMPVMGFGGDIGAARLFGRTLVVARAGALAFDAGGPLATVFLEATRATEFRSVRASIARQPAYESLRSASALVAGTVLHATTALASARAQLTPSVDFYAQADHTWISDGNTRSVASGVGRLKLNETFALLYTAGAATFAIADSTYWSPERYISQGVGLDIRRDQAQGWSVGGRLSPAFAWVREPVPDKPTSTQAVFQGTAQADATWRRNAWEITAYAGYGQDRAGTYVAGFGGLRARVTR
jgi:hypothetical protein